jgi:sulfur relay (sulfurtransferase) complex TusBCD TusD component (DsrE family)
LSSLLLCLFDGPRSEGAYTVMQLARAALESGHTVGVFLGGDGTAHADALAPLRDSGARVVSCSADAAVRGWDRPGTPGRGSFVDLGNMAAEADAMASFGCVATLDGRVVVRHGPSVERGWIALRVATALTFTGRPVHAVLDGPGAGWAARDLDVRAWMGVDPGHDLDGLVQDAGGGVLVGATTLATHGIDATCVRESVHVVDDAWKDAAPSPPPTGALHVVTSELTDPLVVHAIANDAHDGVPVRTLGMHDGVYETAVLARSLDHEGVTQVRLCADDCRRRGLAVPEGRADEYPAIVDALLGASATFVW